MQDDRQARDKQDRAVEVGHGRVGACQDIEFLNSVAAKAIAVGPIRRARKSDGELGWAMLVCLCCSIDERIWAEVT